MTIDVVGRHLELTPQLRSYTEEKVSKLGRLVDNLDIHVTLGSEKHRKTCGIVARGKGSVATGEVTHDDMHQAINEAVDILARQLRKNKTSRLADRREGADSIRHQGPDLEATTDDEH
ncbi:MAG: ribosome-associated translation inhibitor RaiA [Acidobacteria bacterium]|nr:ribosome-associated translation inhibitor RaiA [Acidobacteriota bacterium]